MSSIPSNHGHKQFPKSIELHAYKSIFFFFLLVLPYPKDPDHLGANHYMIHNIEMGPNPEWLLGVADRIFDIDPEDGHITHMASHVYSRMGYHDKVYEMNKIANKLDFEWNVKRTGGGLMTTLYKYEPHNIEFIVVAGWDSGNFAEAAAHVALLDQLSIFRLTANPSLGSLQYPLTFGIQVSLYE